MNATARRTAVLAGFAVLTIASVGIAPAAVANLSDGPALSGKPQTVHVSGRQIPVDVENGLYEMRGALVGKWRYIPQKPPLHISKDNTLYVEAGVEVFNGCIDRRPRDGKCNRRDQVGELHLAFLYWASYDVGGQSLIEGHCVHPITGGKGAFAGARGLLNMVDRPVGGQVKTTYRGDIVLNAVPTEGDAPTPSALTQTTADQRTSPTSQRRGC